MSKDNIVILGAGLAGLSTAYHLERQAREYRLFEKEETVGGLCRSKVINGFTFDCDGHLLHFRHKHTLNLVKRLLQDNLIMHARNAWVYSFDRFTRYPFQANFFGLPSRVVSDCLLGFINATDGRPKANFSFLDWIDHKFGEGIAKHFMVNYNKKFWHYPLEALTCDWIDGLIPVPSMKEVIEGAITQSKRRLGYNAYFWYPRKGGIQELSKAFARRIKNIYTCQEAVRIDTKKKAIYFKNKKKESYHKLISSLPLVELVDMIKDVPSRVAQAKKRLRWISVFNLNLGIDRPLFSGRHWIYFPEKKYIFYRVGFFNNFCLNSVPRNKGSLYIEVSYPAGKKIDKQSLITRILKDLTKAKIISRRDKILTQDENDIKYAYIIYDRQYRQARSEIHDFLCTSDIFSIGRYGSWRYMSMEEAILEGERLARRV